jgi:predicted DNA-binding transcriptional regulator AlpA
MARRRENPSPFSQGGRTFLSGMTSKSFTVGAYTEDTFLLGQQTVANLLLRSVPAFKKLVDAKKFPAPRILGAGPDRVEGWYRDDVNKWLRNNGERPLEETDSRLVLDRMRAVLRPKVGKQTDQIALMILQVIKRATLDPRAIQDSHDATDEMTLVWMAFITEGMNRRVRAALRPTLGPHADEIAWEVLCAMKRPLFDLEMSLYVWDVCPTATPNEADSVGDRPLKVWKACVEFLIKKLEADVG